VFEIICGQDPSALKLGLTDPSTDSALFLLNVGRQTVTYTSENDDGSQTVQTVSPTPLTLGGITGYWVQIAQGTLSENAVPTLIPYADGSVAGANIVIAGETTTSPAQTEAYVVTAQDSAMALDMQGGVSTLVCQSPAMQMNSETSELEETPTGSVTVICVYSPSGTTWNLYALDQSSASDGISFATVKIGNVLTAYNASPEDASYVGNGTNNKAGKFGFSSKQDCNDLGPIGPGGSEAFEIICGQSANDLQNGTVDPRTGYAYFVKYLGQEEVSYDYVANRNGTDIETTTVGSLTTLGGIEGHWLLIGQGTMAEGEVPVVIPYADGSSAAANIVISGGNETVPVQAEAFVTEQ
jgi:hypothetical protein